MQLLNSTQIPNTLLEALFVKDSEFTEEEKDMLLYICRKTIGWQKETDWMTLKYISEETGKAKQHVSRTMISLEKKNAIVREKSGKLGWFFSLNEHRWGVTQHVTSGNVTRYSAVTSHVTPSNKRNSITKDNLTKEETHGVSGSEVNYVLEFFKEVNPSYEKLYANKTQRAAMARLLSKHGKEKVVWAVRAIGRTNEMKYAPTITTPLQLENKLGHLVSFVKKESGESKYIKI